MDDMSDQGAGGREVLDGKHDERPAPRLRHRKPQMQQDWLMAPPPVGGADAVLTSYFAVEYMTTEIRPEQ